MQKVRKKYTLNPVDRFYLFCDKKKINGCIEFNGEILSSGYGRLMVKGKKILAHRYSYLLHKDEIPQGMFVLHKCDNRKCVAPEHLWIGTNQDNMNDMISKGRANPQRGEKNPFSKLKEKDVSKIKNILMSGTQTMTEIAKKYNVSIACVSGIYHGKSWKHIEIELPPKMDAAI